MNHIEWKTDEAIESNLIKTNLLFNKLPDKKATRDASFQKELLARIFTGDITCKDDTLSYFKRTRSDMSIDEGRITRALSILVNKKFISIEQNGKILITENAEKEASAEAWRIRQQFEKMISDLLKSVKDICKVRLGLEEVVKRNIKDCIDYYYETSGYAFFGIDNQQELGNLPKVEEIAGKDIADQKIVESILYALGMMLDKPSQEQKDTMETLAKTFVTSQIIGIDPQLSNFKQSVIGSKAFVLDTDFVLYALVQNGRYSKQYRMLIDQLASCGCKLYIPKEVISEVYDHAAAAFKRYTFISQIISNADEDWVIPQLLNIFLEDYYFTQKDNKSLTWITYLSNFYNSKHGLSYTNDVLTHEFDKKVLFEDFLKDKVDVVQKEQLFEKVLEATKNTPKAKFRDPVQNESIARTDTLFYLTVKQMNEEENRRNGDRLNKNVLLANKYYVLTNSTRVYHCACGMGLGAKVLCSPAALIAYMMESGVMDKNSVEILSLFNNPFLSYIAENSWDETKKMIEVGLDFKDKNIIAMRYELKDEVDKLLTYSGENAEYAQMVRDIKHKGYKFHEQVEKAIQENHDKDLKLENAQEEIEQLKAQLAKMANSNKHLTMQLGQEKYQKRVGTLKEKKKKR